MARGTGLSSLQCLQRGGFDAQVGGLEALGGRHHVFWLLVQGARPANTAGKKTRSEEKEKKKRGGEGGGEDKGKESGDEEGEEEAAGALIR